MAKGAKPCLGERIDEPRYGDEYRLFVPHKVLAEDRWSWPCPILERVAEDGGFDKMQQMTSGREEVFVLYKSQ